MNASGIPVLRASKATRSSLACVPCRSRHLKCDGSRPGCSRCCEAAQECHYAPSRRGGLDRAALVERRKQRHAAAQSGEIHIPDTQFLTGACQEPLCTDQVVDIPSQRACVSSTEISISSGSEASSALPTGTVQVHVDNIQSDRLVNSYYQNFHIFHPFLLPQKHLVRLHQDPSRQLQLKPLIAFMRFIGEIYASGNFSTPLEHYAEACLSQARPLDPILVQCQMLYSIALYWSDRKAEALYQIDNAIRLAIDLQMYQKEFPLMNGGADSILRECWRRTWWMLYIVDTYYSGTLGSMRADLADIKATVELPCEELEFESGIIPKPQTLQDFDNREFMTGKVLFSSFAYLVGAVRCAALSIASSERSATKPDSMHVLQRIDSILNAWMLLLPKEKKQVVAKNGDLDELMFQAHLLIHVAIISLHRPFSELKSNPVESISSCARDAAPERPTPDLVNIHTLRVLRSAEEQIQLLSLPVPKFQHTPFVTCMITQGTLALLSACKFLFKGMDLTIARNQVRTTIGCLNSLAEIWPRAARIVREIQTIARHVLGLVPGTSEGQLCARGEGPRSPRLQPSDIDAALPDSFADLCGWYNIADIDLSGVGEQAMRNDMILFE